MSTTEEAVAAAPSEKLALSVGDKSKVDSAAALAVPISPLASAAPRMAPISEDEVAKSETESASKRRESIELDEKSVKKEFRLSINEGDGDLVYDIGGPPKAVVRTAASRASLEDTDCM